MPYWKVGAMEFKSRLNQKPRIDIIPMIDVIFFLLIFFMLFTTFKTNPYGLDIKLPQSSTAAKNEDQSINLEIDKNGNFNFEGVQVSAAEFSLLVRQKQQQIPHIVAVINADQETPYDYVIKAIDIMRESGVFRIAFGVEPK